ncbi:MAG: phosphatidylglycerol lysyltransferase [Treponema sp.]|jgi:phosphoglucomutase|nr:phosphatidylglycerol lysyltransferase [Treponema sp.]
MLTDCQDSARAGLLLDRMLQAMLFSASGWRGVFAASGNGESAETAIAPPCRLIAAAAAKVFAEYLAPPGGGAPELILGMDTRPTGPAIADAMLRVLLGAGCAVRFTGPAAAPEIMAYARSFQAGGGTRGFVFISASHNPIGHNGLKFGLTDGAVLSGAEAGRLLSAFKALMSAPDRIDCLHAALRRAGPDALSRLYAGRRRIKHEALAAYRDFTREVVSGFPGKADQEAFLRTIREGVARRPLGIGADLNGSARTLSIDQDFLSGLGIPLRAVNAEPGNIAHRIVPEGESLDTCRELLERLHQEDPAFLFGYLPDCDGDRGNLVVWDDRAGSSRVLEAQEVFALACVSELAHLVWTGELAYDGQGRALGKAALAVTDPTSLRIDRIARAFDVPVFRSEVGEANVVGLARRLREQGYVVRILGEGSAGGNITHPSAVRDPLNTIMALVKLLTIRSGQERKGFFELWCGRSDQAGAYRPDFTLTDLMAALPPFATTGVYDPEALLRVNAQDHGGLKDRYQAVFLQEWEERKEYLESRYGLCRWEAAAYQGMEERRGIARFGEAGKGGLRIIFSNKAGIETACIWMRGSATEAVFRIMADAEGPDRRLERDLIEWQRRMVIKADSALP